MEGLEIKTGEVRVEVLSAVQLAKINVNTKSHIWTIELDGLDIVGAIIIHLFVYNCLALLAGHLSG